MAEFPGVAEMLAGQCVFVTGGSGLLGKVLVEKLVRSCPDIGTVYLLLRPKKGKSVQERLQDILSTPLFAPLLERCPEAALKLRAVAGDAAELRLGLSEEDEARLQEEVDLFFHVGALTRFTAPLRDAILHNVRSAREAAELAKRMPRLKALQYVSTASVYLKAPVLEELVYHPGYDWKTLIQLAETTDYETLNAFSMKIINWFKLTYPFSKCLAENVIHAYRHDIPVCIFRPGLVASSIQEPFPGWMDSLSGTMGLIPGISTGALRSLYCDPNLVPPYTFVDWAVRGMILTCWATAVDLPLRPDSDRINVVNMVYDGKMKNFQELTETCLAESHIMPYHVRYPRAKPYSSFLVFWLVLLFSEAAYAVVFDSVCRIIGSKPRLLAISRISMVFLQVISFISFTPLKLKMDNLEIIEKFLPQKDFAAFTSRLNVHGSPKIDQNTFYSDMVKGVTQYVFKEAVDTQKAKRRLQILFVLEVVQYTVLAVIFFSIFVSWTTNRGSLS